MTSTIGLPGLVLVATTGGGFGVASLALIGLVAAIIGL